MADLTTSALIDTFMGAANAAAARSTLGLDALAVLTPGTGVATALAVNVGSAGAFVILGGALGTPSSGTLTSCTGLPVSTGISGFGTGVATALAVNTGSAGAFVILNGAGGTPASLTLTNATGLPVGSLANSAAGADRLLMWDESASDWVECTLGTNLSFSGTTLNASGGAGGGDVSGPGSSTDSAIVLWDGIGGDTVKDSTITVDGSGNMANVGNITGGALAVTSAAPVSNDGAALGSGAVSWSDLFLASGALINFANGNLTLTHSSGVLTSSGAYVGTTATLGSTTSLLLGTAGSAVGNIGFRNATSGTITLAPTTGALGTVTQTLQAVAGTIYCSSGTDVAVADGGTGLSSGTSGGVLAFTASGTLASSGALAANAIVIGGGAGAAPSTTTTGTGVLTQLGLAADGSDVDAIGFRGIPQNAQTGNYTCVMADAGKCIFHASGAGAGDTYTIPANASVAYEVGTVIKFKNMDSNSVAIAITTDTMTFLPAGTTGSRTLAQYGEAYAEKIASTAWTITGNSALT